MRAKFSVVCDGCGKEYETVSHYHRWCPACKLVQARKRAEQFEKENRHPCPDCGVEIARTSVRCRACGKKSRIQKITGPGNYAWKGGRSKDQWGYVRVLVAPEARKGHRYQPEHRLVWEKTHGIPLPKGWIVHHINHVKGDNRPENLLAMPRATHNHQHGEQRILELETENAALREQLNATDYLHPQI